MGSAADLQSDAVRPSVRSEDTGRFDLEHSLANLERLRLAEPVLVDRNARGDDVAGFLQLVESARIEDAAVVQEWRPVDPFEDPDVEGVESPEHPRFDVGHIKVDALAERLVVELLITALTHSVLALDRRLAPRLRLRPWLGRGAGGEENADDHHRVHQ